MEDLQQIFENNFYLVNAVIAILFIVVYGLLLVHLIGHMREMVRLKYHVDKRAEFDESRVKIIIGVIMLLGLIYLAVWVFCLATLDIDKKEDYELASALFKSVSASLLVGAYVIFFINNRVKGDIEHIKRTVDTKPDESQHFLNHL